MGHHFLNPDITGFDITKPPILVYVKRGGKWQLVAFEWVFTETPATPPLPGAEYGSFAAACHYVDGTFVPAARRGRLPAEEPHERREVRLLAPGLRDPPPLGLVPEPGRDLQRHEPARAPLQRLISILRKVSPGPRAWAPCFHVTR